MDARNRQAILARIRERAEKHGAKTKLADALQCSRQAIYAKLNRDDGLTDRELLIAAKFFDLEVPVDGFSEELANFGPPAIFAQVPRFDVRLSAGGGAFQERIRVLDWIPFTQDFIRRKLGRSNADGLIIVEAAGDSMEPTIDSGDLVMIDQADRSVTDGLFAVVIGDALMVKRLRRRADGVEVASDNAELYPPMFFPGEAADELNIVGRVRWIGRVL